MTKKEQSEITRLKQLLQDQEVGAKMLVRRDLELTRAYEKLQKLGQMKSDFISVVAHQLRTPLSVTKWALDILEESTSSTISEEEKSVLARGKESNERMIQLVDDLLNVDLHETGKVQYSFAEVAVADIVQSVLDSLLPLAAQQKVTLEYKLPDTPLPVLHADAEKLSAALQNIIENALKYSPEGAVVGVTVEYKGKDVVLAVHDTGIGISKEDATRIFSKFYRGTNATRTETEGSGLGLFMARKIVKRHGGDVWFESSEGKGTTFYLSIPVEINK